MTNREWLNKLSNEWLAKYLSEWIDCKKCPVATSCGGWTCRERLEKWLQSEHKEKIVMALTKCDFCTNPNNQRVKSGEVQPWSDYGYSTDNCGEALQLMMEYTRLTCAPHSKEITVNKNYTHNGKKK